MTAPQRSEPDDEITLPLAPAEPLAVPQTEPVEPVEESSAEPAGHVEPEPAGPDPVGPEPVGPEPAVPASRPRRRLSATGTVIAVLVGLLGFALIVQVRGASTDATLATARQDDLVRILSDLDSNEDRLRKEISDLQQLKRDLTAGSESAEAAKQAAEKRADELGILAGTLPARGPGLRVRFASNAGNVRAAHILDAVEELRNAGAEAMQIAGANGQAVRIIGSTYFTDSGGEMVADGVKLTGPYVITVIGDAATMKTALNIPGGVVSTVGSDGGNVIVEDPGTVSITALAMTPGLQYAQPAS
jgi:uncharacterized protein YlxW (UPF0749 family)